MTAAGDPGRALFGFSNSHSLRRVRPNVGDLAFDFNRRASSLFAVTERRLPDGSPGPRDPALLC